MSGYGFDSWRKLKAFVDGVTVTRLIEAVRAGDLARVGTMLEARPEIVNMDASGNDEHRALHHAVLMRSPDMVRLLMARGADAHVGIYPHRDPTTALAIATERGYDEIVAIIHDAEEKRRGVQLATRVAPTPPVPRELNDAIQHADSGAVIAFLESSPLLGEDPSLISRPGPEGLTLLHIASARLMVDLVAWLLARGADVAVRSDKGFAPIDMLGRWPAANPHDGLDEVANLLLKHGAERTAFWAVATNDLVWLRARHAEGRLENRVSDGGGLVTFAVRLDRPEALTLLLDLGFDPNEGDGKPLEYAASLRRPAMTDTLLRRGAALTAPLAVALGKADWLRARHDAGTLVHPSDGDGLLTVAVTHGRADILQLLLELGFDADERKRKIGGDGVYESRGIPLERCVVRNEAAMAELLLAHGADPNGQTEGGGTPVSTAYRKRDRADARSSRAIRRSRQCRHCRVPSRRRACPSADSRRRRRAASARSRHARTNGG